MRRHASHGTGYAGVHAVLGLVVRLVVANGVNQIVPLVQVRIILTGDVLRLPEHIRPRGFLTLVSAGRPAEVAMFGGDGNAFRAMRVAGINVVATRDATTIHVELRAV